MTLDAAVLALLKQAWPGHPFPIRPNKLAAAVGASRDETVAALRSLTRAGELSAVKGDGRRCALVVALRHPPAGPATLFTGSFRPIPKDTHCNTSYASPASASI